MTDPQNTAPAEENTQYADPAVPSGPQNDDAGQALDDQESPETTAQRLADLMETLPPELPRYVVEAFLIDTVQALLDLNERTNG